MTDEGEFIPDEERKIDEIQFNVMEVLKGCGLDPDQVLNIMLSIALSLAEEMDEKKPIKIIMDRVPTIKAWQESFKN